MGTPVAAPPPASWPSLGRPLEAWLGDREPGHAFEALHHVQLLMPTGQEPAAREFYAGLLGMAEVAKPPILAARGGGVWFRAGGVEVHFGVEAEEDFHPAGKAHPALLVRGLDELAARLRAGGVEVRWDDAFPGFRRFYAIDPFGNRLELMEPDGR